MPKVLFVYRIDRLVPSNHGVIQKLKGQIKAWQASGWHVDYILQSGHEITLNQKPIKTVSANRSWTALTYYDGLITAIDQDYEVIILRYGLSTSSFYKFVKRIKSKNPQAQIIIDMPTYPYEAEWKYRKDQAVLLMDKYYRKKLLPLVNYILHSGQEKEILGIPTIHWSNGIDVDEYPLREIQPSPPLTMLAVGKWQFWHGLDRLILGLKASSDHTIRLDIVGDGPALKGLQALVKEQGMDTQVTFRGALTGERMDHLFNRAHLGVGTLAPHRKNLIIDSSLKHREYTVRGLPFMLVGPDSDIVDPRFVYTVPPTDAPIDLQPILRFVSEINYEKISKEMRSFAKERLSWTHKVEQLHIKLKLS